MGSSAELLVDPAVSRAKFEREIAAFRELGDDYRRRGWWLLDVSFPEVLVAFVARQLRPAAVIFGALLDFTNYDLWAPSVRLVDPFTRVPYRRRELPSQLTRRIPRQLPPELAPLGIQPVELQPLMQAHGDDDVPFLCIPGVREYHDHPAHTGDSWLLHRGLGEGTLDFLLTQLAKYGVEPIRGYQIGLAITGFTHAEPPE